MLLETRQARARQVTAVVAPVSLAVYALGQEHISFLDSVTAGFGWFLAEHFEPEKAALFWVAIASLAASIYYGYGARPGLCTHIAGVFKPGPCCSILRCCCCCGAMGLLRGGAPTRPS